ncbi:hypothetical protein PHMEG_00014103 [Phytophthora megakarya]|uniref:Uncharacterized protein n=1 Tax=Phytophthora megakarya TaxID=4795 RepID=A0A225W4T3_9STRA|nr:hypothetical protein PHMEG_00014103 [Phytophthora megakarya]
MVHNYNRQRPHLFDLSAIREATTGQIKAVAWVMEMGLLGRTMLCLQCAQSMRLDARECYWCCCRKTRHADLKQKQHSIFVNSWFTKMKLTLPQSLRLMFARCMRSWGTHSSSASPKY